MRVLPSQKVQRITILKDEHRKKDGERAGYVNRQCVGAQGTTRATHKHLLNDALPAETILSTILFPISLSKVSKQIHRTILHRHRSHESIHGCIDKLQHKFSPLHHPHRRIHERAWTTRLLSTFPIFYFYPSSLHCIHNTAPLATLPNPAMCITPTPIYHPSLWVVCHSQHVHNIH